MNDNSKVIFSLALLFVVGIIALAGLIAVFWVLFEFAGELREMAGSI